MHNLRCALDSLVYMLVIPVHGNPLPQAVAKRVQFPVAEDGGVFTRTKWRIEDIPSAAQAEIEWLQPCIRRPDDPTRDPLYILTGLSNIDKHRLPHLMLFALASTGFGGSAQFKISRQREAATVEDRAKLLPSEV